MNMSRSLLVLAIAITSMLPAQEAGRERLTWEDTRNPNIRWMRDLPGVGWAWDGVHVDWNRGKGTVWIDPATGKTVDVQKKPDSADDAAPPARKVLLVHEGDLWLDEVADGPGRSAEGRRPGGRGGARPATGKPSDKALRLTKDGVAKGAKSQAHLSPDGARATFVRDGNLVVVDAATGAEWAVTKDGGPEMFHGILDWVYQEEIYGRGDFQGHWWSKDSGMVAFLSLDETPVKDFTIVDEVPQGFLDKERSVVAEITNYPKAGDPNPIARMSVAHVATNKIVAVDLSAYPKDLLVARVEWTPDGKTLLLVLQDRIQTWAELCGVDPATGAITKWIREESPTWVNRPDPMRWLADGSFLWLSERTGYNHVYRYKPGGQLVGAVTSGEWQVRGIERVDEAKGVLWFEGTKDGAVERNVYRVGLDGKNLVRLTPGAGTHQVEYRKDGAFLIDRWSAMDRPTTVRLIDGATGAVVKEFGQAGRGDAEKYAFAAKRRLAIKARDGYELDGSLMLPTEYDAARKYPIYLPTYSGPDAPSVHDAWLPSTPNSTYQQFLCQQGFIVLQVNVRSASRRGQQHIGICYKQLGVQELKDLEDAVDLVVKDHGGDPARVAIEGWSYGGFMAAYALTHSKKFTLGLAGAGVYDWRLYDTVYTERYMRLPDENKQGYDATSVIKAANDLHGHLVLMHGTMDDNVHLQNTLQLVWELERLGKMNFEMMLYPRSRHGLSGLVTAHQKLFAWTALKKLLDPHWTWQAD